MQDLFPVDFCKNPPTNSLLNFKIKSYKMELYVLGFPQ